MIAKIKNTYLRRALCCVLFIPFLVVILCLHICEAVLECAERVGEAW